MSKTGFGRKLNEISKEKLDGKFLRKVEQDYIIGSLEEVVVSRENAPLPSCCPRSTSLRPFGGRVSGSTGRLSWSLFDRTNREHPGAVV